MNDDLVRRLRSHDPGGGCWGCVEWCCDPSCDCGCHVTEALLLEAANALTPPVTSTPDAPEQPKP